MKRSILYTAAIALLATGIVSCSSSRSGNEETATTINGVAIPALLERKTASGPDGEKETIRSTYNKAVDALKANPDNPREYINLASAFITEGRVTGNGSYYSNAAATMLDKAVDNSAGDKDLQFQALSLKSAVLLNMHQFKDALAVAQKGVAMNDFNAGIYGALVDANVELGNYDEAVKDCDKMLSIRPDLRSYSRASYLRQIFGDNRGAIDAMKLAVEAGVPGAESTEWARVTLGDLYLNTGNTDSANYQYKSSLVYRPAYPYAEMGLARVEKANKHYDEAIVHTRNAIRILSESSFVSFLGDLYDLKGDKEQAEKVHGDVVRLLEDAEKDQPKDAPIKHNANRELANAYIGVHNLDKALSYAQTDLNIRPENIDANELMAWVLYLKADYAHAKMYADKMLRIGTKNANTLYKASLIYAAAGDKAKSSELKQTAMQTSPFVDQKLLAAK